jgi:hypothetical protein
MKTVTASYRYPKLDPLNPDDSLFIQLVGKRVAKKHRKPPKTLKEALRRGGQSWFDQNVR